MTAKPEPENTTASQTTAEPGTDAPRRHRRSVLPMVTSEAFETLEPEWTALHRSIPSATVFSHPRWYANWLKHFGEAARPVWLSVRVEEELVGVVPLDFAAAEGRALGDPQIQDYTGMLVRPGFEDALASGLLEWLWEDLSESVELWGIAADSPLRAAFVAQAERLGWDVADQLEAHCPRAALPADWPSFVASLSKHDRHELRRKLRNLEAAGSIETSHLVAPGELDAGVETLLRLMRASRADKDAFLTPTMEAFFRGIAEEFGGSGLASICEVHLDGETVASLFSFETAEATLLYNSGFALERAPLAVGLLSKALAIRDAIERGKTWFDFLRGDEDYKRHLGGVPTDVLTLRLSQRR